LVGEWDKLVERIRRVGGFEHFLKPVPFRELRQAATAECVAVVNVSQYGADALIFDSVHPIKHVPLPQINIEKLNSLSRNLLLKRPIKPQLSQQQRYIDRYLRPALRNVWQNIVVPIFDEMQIPLQWNAGAPSCRIWWYPTGPLTFLPIHAAGNDAVDVSRLVVSSYVTTLHSLLQARKKIGPSPMGRQKLLTVSQPDTPGQKPLPFCTTEVEEVARVVHQAGWSENDIVRLHGLDATVSHVSRALETCSWVHFACHGFQHSKFGMESALALYDGDFALHQIASKRLSVGRLAFLSVCHAASGLRSLPGEAMHIAAGLQFAGFSSVIASIWAVSDEDAPAVAAATYKYLLRNGPQRCDHSEAAAALNLAVSDLRKNPEVTLDRWIPFVHFGT
jgi:CHAT domain